MNHHYNMNGLQAHNMTQPHLNGISQRREGQHDSQSLPPLTGAVPGYSPYSVGMSQHPVTSTASYPASSQPQYGSSLPQLAPQQPHGIPMGAYSQPGAYASMTQSMMAPSSTSMVSNLPPTPSSRLPDLHPRPQDGSTLLAQLQQHSMQNPLLAPGQNPSEPEPTHVVGQQGRRGILPSAPGRAPGNVRSTVPIKDADGKYPCPHCNKTYQHAKHLKRHLLRHTGDRPYMCKLCKDTFSRSDILKRHFQKCSVRRGVVGDMDHLEGSRAHLQKNRQPVDASQNMQFLNPSPVNPSPVYDSPNGLSGLPPAMMQQSPYGDMQPNSARNSRSNSVVRQPSGFIDSRRSMSAMEQMNSSRPGDFQSYSAFSTPGGLPSMLPNGTHPGSATHSPVSAIPNGINGHGYNGFGAPDSFQQVQRADVEGAQIGSPGWITGFRVQHQSSASLDRLDPQQEGHASRGGYIYMTHDVRDHGLDGLYTDISHAGTSQAYAHWDLGDPIQAKISSIITACLASTDHGPEQADHTLDKLQRLLTTENVGDFLAEFRNYQGHWPMLHMPTLDPTVASDSLVLAMLCIGAVYSDRISISETRWLMERAKRAVHSTSCILAEFDESTAGSASSCERLTEDLQALLLLQCLFLWHGTAEQRACAREDWPRFAVMARRCQLLSPMSSSSTGRSSILHHADLDPQRPDEYWDWYTWIEQEKRSRAFYILYLVDCAMAIYFNALPQIDPSEIELCLPADDAAWEATNPNECADQLGLERLDESGAYVARGGGRCRQPRFSTCLSSYFNPLAAAHEPPIRTNAYGKFILIHALHAILWVAQKRAVPGTPATRLQSMRFPGSECSTPGSNASAIQSGASTPDIVGLPGPPAFFSARVGLRDIRGALEAWKRCWDADSDSVHSPSRSNGQPHGDSLPRIGFYRDGIYYYYLAVQFYKRSSPSPSNVASPAGNHQEIWQLAPDARFAYVLHLVKRIKHWLLTEQGKMGQEPDLGSMGKIDDRYGAADLTLDMSLLFTRLVPRVSLGARAP